MSTVKVELAVEMTCQSCVESVTNALRSQSEVKDFSIDLSDQQVIVETTGSIGKIAQHIEQNTGMRVRIRGMAGAQGNLGAAVCMFRGLSPFQNIQGVVRIVQLSPSSTIFEAAVSGLPLDRINNKLSINIHQLGDTSLGAESTGSIFTKTIEEPSSSSSSSSSLVSRIIAGTLGFFQRYSKTGAAALRFESNHLQVWELIGRSMVIEEVDSEVQVEEERKGKYIPRPALAVGVIARSSGVFQNDKKICACTGKTLWEEEVTDLSVFS